jgi:hypothetical protein
MVDTIHRLGACAVKYNNGRIGNIHRDRTVRSDGRRKRYGSMVAKEFTRGEYNFTAQPGSGKNLAIKRRHCVKFAVG